VYDREWADASERDAWAKEVMSVKNCSELIGPLLRLDEGMSQPFSLI
jgi:hypothetical protein